MPHLHFRAAALLSSSSFLFAALSSFGASAAPSELRDEIQVHDDAIVAPGQTGLELHVNTTPAGRPAPDASGEEASSSSSVHAWRITPEFSWGLARGLEAGLYLPMVRDAEGNFSLAGARMRLKWLPWRPGDDDGSGGFAGIELELSRLARRWSESSRSGEARFIAGWRTAAWWLAVNPSLFFRLSEESPGGRRPDLGLAVKFARRMAPGIAAGFEFYDDAGPLGRRLPWRQQDGRIYLAFDVDRAPWRFNLGLGRGLTHAADRWTLKAIFDVPLSSSSDDR